MTCVMFITDLHAFYLKGHFKDVSPTANIRFIHVMETSQNNMRVMTEPYQLVCVCV